MSPQASIKGFAGLALSTRSQLGGTVGAKAGTSTGIAFESNLVLVTLETVPGINCRLKGYGLGLESRLGGGDFELDHDDEECQRTKSKGSMAAAREFL